jgi:DNA polymerase-3 subunit alpha
MSNERAPALPSFSSEPGFSEHNEIKQQSKLGLSARLQQKFSENQYNQQQQQEITLQYQERLKYELEIIIKMNFAGYFLIVSDFIKWSKQQQILVLVV